MDQKKLSVEERFDKSYNIVKSRIDHAENPNKSWRTMPAGKQKMKAKRKLAYAYVDAQLFKEFIENQESNQMLRNTRLSQLATALEMINAFLEKNRPGDDGKTGLTEGTLRDVRRDKYEKYMQELRENGKYEERQKETKLDTP